MENSFQDVELVQDEETDQQKDGGGREDVESNSGLRGSQTVVGDDGVRSDTDVDEREEIQPSTLVSKVDLESVEEFSLVQHLEVVPELVLGELVDDEENDECECYEEIQDEKRSILEVV